MKKIKHLATIGCSHSSDMVGDSWPIFLKQILDCDHSVAFSNGAGNEANIEKVKFLVDQRPDLLVVQLTDPARFTVGLFHQSLVNRPNRANDPTYLTGSQYYDGQLYYTFNPFSNDENLMNATGYPINADEFIIKHVITSNYNLYNKVLHTISTMAFFAEKKNVPIVFFSWCVDIQEIINKCGYSDIFKDLNIIPSYIEEFVKENNLKPIPVGTFGAGHHASENQKIICENFILPYLRNRGLVQ